MKNRLLIIIFLVGKISISQQAIEVILLSDTLNETSGLLYLNGKIISHNDSGDGPYLYELDSTNGGVNRTVVIENAVHTDWEDLAIDDNFIYIGDFGNNTGDRTNLIIYKLSINDFLSSTNDSVTVDTIQFSYSDQTDFTSNQFNTNFDAEAFVALGDSLYIFTKNWIDSKTNIYSLSINPGIQTAVKVDSIDSQGLVAGADYDQVSNQIILCGYATVNPFILTISQFTAPQFSSGTQSRSNIQINGSAQLEGICSLSEHEHYLSTEVNFTGAAKLHRLSFAGFSNFDSSEEHTTLVYPNPVKSELYIDSEQDFIIEIYDIRGFLKKSNQGVRIDISGLESGVHIMKLIHPVNYSVITKKIVIE